MRVPFLLTCFGLLVSVSLSCTSPSREGLPPESPFQESVVPAKDLLPQGIAMDEELLR